MYLWLPSAVEGQRELVSELSVSVSVSVGIVVDEWRYVDHFWVASPTLQQRQRLHHSRRGEAMGQVCVALEPASTR